MPLLKGEVPAARAVWFGNTEFGNSICPAAIEEYSSQTSVGVWGSAKRSEASPSQPASATPTSNPQGILRIRRTQPLQFMAAGFVFYPAVATECRLSLPEPAAAAEYRLSLPDLTWI